MPSENVQMALFLKPMKNEAGNKIDANGNISNKNVDNPYLDDFHKKWDPKNPSVNPNNHTNPSIPKLINPK